MNTGKREVEKCFQDSSHNIIFTFSPLHSSSSSLEARETFFLRWKNEKVIRMRKDRRQNKSKWI